MSALPPPIRTGLHVTVTRPSPVTSATSVPALQSTSPPVPPVPQTPSSSCLDFISSDETLDRYSEIICASGWKLDSYLRNPVFQNAHQYGDILHTLGRALITEVRTRQPSTLNPQLSTYLFQRIEFAIDANPIANLAFKLYQGAFLKAVSVGFTPIRWEEPPPASQPSTQQFRRKYLEQELFEVSAVSIPANPNALALALKSGAVEKSDLRDLVDVCSLTLPASTSQLSTLNSQPSLASLARLAATLLKR